MGCVWTYENSQPLLFLPCHKDCSGFAFCFLTLLCTVRGLIPEFWGAEIGDQEIESQRDEKKGKRVERQEAQGLVMEDFSRQFREEVETAVGHEGSGWKEEGNFFECHDLRVPECGLGQATGIWEMQEIAQVILKLLLIVWWCVLGCATALKTVLGLVRVTIAWQFWCISHVWDTAGPRVGPPSPSSF